MRKTFNLFFYLVLISVFVSCSSTKQLTDKKNERLNEKKEIEFGRTYIDGSKEKILGNFDVAAALFQKAIQIDPSNAAAHYELGLCYNSLSKFEEAFNEFKIATELDPSEYWYKLSYASFLENNGQIDEAIKSFKELAESSPSQIELRYELAKLLSKQKRIKESIAELNKIEKKIGISEEISFLKQRIYLSVNDVDGAANEIEELITSSPHELKYYSILSDIYLSNGKNEQALEVFRRMEEIDSNNYQLDFSLAEYYRAIKDREQFLVYLKRAFENPEMNIDDKIKYILTYYRVDSRDKENKAEGISLCKSIVKGNPKNPKSHALLADFLYFDEQLEEAKQAYFETIALDSSRFPVWNQLLVILSETNDLPMLLKYGARATELFPNQSSVFLMYGLGLAQSKQHDKAIENYEIGKDLVFDNDLLLGQLYASIGDSYYALNNFEKAYDSYESALKYDPNNSYVLNNYSYYLSEEKKELEKAKKMSFKSNQLVPGQASYQDTYAWILYQMKDYQGAKDWIDKAIKSEESASEVLLEHKGDILFQLGQVEEALRFWMLSKEKGNTSEQLMKKIEEKKMNE